MDDWHAVLLPGKRATEYTPRSSKEGRVCVAARSERSASLWRRKFTAPPQSLGEVSFSWWVQQALADGNVADIDREDASVRIVFAFGGDTSKLPRRTRMMFDLAEALTGEAPPYATLMYVWDGRAAVGSIVVNPRSDRVRKIVVDTGEKGLRQWRDHRRDLVADFRQAFGEDPGPLQAIAVMTDTDNTGARADAWYGPITLH
jgi:Protein of unknown function (DUF3047)